MNSPHRLAWGVGSHRSPLGERVTEPELSLGEFFAALSAEIEKSPKIVPEYVAAAQSREARRQRRDAIIAERGRLYEASKRLVAGEVS